jgi:hypothetical protein
LNDFAKIKTYRQLFLEILLNELNRPRRLASASFSSSSQQSSSTPGASVVVSRNDVEIWLNTCCIKLKQLNYEHAKILIEYKQYVQFPDLYAELYNL